MKKLTMTPERQAEWQAQRAAMLTRMEASKQAEPVLALVERPSLATAKAGVLRSRANLRSGR